MKLVQSILTKNPCYTAGRKITVKGLMLHSVGCPQPKASVFINSWNSPSYDNACVHGFIDGNDGTVYQTLPWNHRGWHCGSGSKGSGNNTHIGVEMCEPACIKYTGGANFTCSDIAAAKAVAKRTYEAAVELFAYLCRQYNLNPAADGVIISHREGHSRGIASNHGDPEHLWKGLGLGYTMDGFRKDVKAAMGGAGTTEPENGGWYRVRKSWTDAKSQKGAFKVLANARKCADENPGYSVYDESGKAVYGGKGSGGGFSPYLVQVSITDLNIRKGPGTNYGKTGKYTGKGVFTIVEEASGQGASCWGKLKSGAGWICIDAEFCTPDGSTGNTNTSTNTSTTGGTAYMFEVRVITLGAQGNDVLLLQEILKARGYYNGALDKSFGPETQAALIAYQTDRQGGAGEVDGVAGPKCWADLIAL